MEMLLYVVLQSGNCEIRVYMIQETFFQKYDTLIDKALGIGNLHGQSQEKQLCPFYRELFVKLILLLRVHTKLEMVSIL
jgi:hypothetical protein